ncbi:hypothetical protein [Nostoc sp.]|uniref:hypothetical protein n=1 Tax=Nostoc sp. TaxID=1180 RepID=UPI0035935A87
MPVKSRKKLTFLVIGCFLSAWILSLAVGFHSSHFAVAAEKSSLVRLQNLQKIVVNSSFISPLVELFGNVFVGKKVFVASNTVLSADPDTQICLGNETNLQDNILLLALRSTPAPSSNCGKRSSSTGERVSIAHQAKIKNSKIGNFTFIGFLADLNNVVLEDGAFVLHGAKISNVRIGKNLNTDDNIVFHGPLEVGDNLTIEDDAVLFRSKVGNNVTIGTGAIVVGVTLEDGVKVPEAAVITTQEQADTLKAQDLRKQ